MKIIEIGPKIISFRILELLRNFSVWTDIFPKPIFSQSAQNFDGHSDRGGKMTKLTLKELYVDELRELYDAENRLVKALPKLAKAAESDDLREGFEQHLEQTKEHVERLEEIFEALDEKPTGKKC